MADRSKLYDNDRSKKKAEEEEAEEAAAWKKGSRRMIDGKMYESQGHVDDQTDADKQKAPALLKDKHFWTPVPEEATPTS